MFKKTLKRKKTDKVEPEDAIALFQYTHEFAKYAEEKRRRNEAEQQQQQQQRAKQEVARTASNDSTASTQISNSGANELSPDNKSKLREKSDDVAELRMSDRVASPLASVTADCTRPASGTTTTASAIQTPAITTIVLDDSDDDQAHTICTSAPPQDQDCSLPLPVLATEYHTANDDFGIQLPDSEPELIPPPPPPPPPAPAPAPAPASQTVEPTKPAAPRRNTADDEYQRFVQEAREREEKVRRQREAGQKPDTLLALVVSRIPNTTELMGRIRVDQELRLLRDTWAIRNHLKAPPAAAASLPTNLAHLYYPEIFLTWNGTEVHDYTTCVTLGIRATEDSRAKLDDSTGVAWCSRSHRAAWEIEEGGFRNGAVLLEAWTRPLFEEHQRQKELEKKRRKLEEENYFLLNHDSTGTGGPGAGAGTATSSALTGGTGSKIRIQLKPKTGDAVKITAYSTTTAGELLASFRKQKGLPETGKPDTWINFDGDRLQDNQTVEELEIEDMDELDVVVK